MKKKYWKVFVSTIVKCEDEVLVLKRKKDGYFGDYYDFPGGKMEYGEHIEEAALRELYEETGLKIKKEDLNLKGYIDWIDEFEKETRYAVCFCFVYDVKTKPKNISLNKEHTLYKWVTKDDKCLDPFLVDILNRCGI